MSVSTPHDLADTSIDWVDVRGRVCRIGKTLYRDYPWRDSLEPWQRLIAEVLLQRTRADAVAAVLPEFFRKYRTLEELSRANVDELTAAISSLGLRWRAPLLVALALELLEMGRIPSIRAELVTLPGVGEYVAGAWLSLHLNRRAVLVDSNTVRFVCRLMGSDYDSETRRKAWVRVALERLTPKSRVRSFNYALLDFTREICSPRRPACSECPLSLSHCAYSRLDAVPKR